MMVIFLDQHSFSSGSEPDSECDSGSKFVRQTVISGSNYSHISRFNEEGMKVLQSLMTD